MSPRHRPGFRRRRRVSLVKALVGALLLAGLGLAGLGFVLSEITSGGLVGGGSDDPSQTPGGPALGSDDPFVDDDGSPFEDAIEQLAAAGVTSGCGPPEERTFCPGEPVNRGELSAFLAGVLDLPTTGVSGFDDVDPDGPFAGPTRRLAAAGIVQGCTEDRFCPVQEVTRAQMAAFLARALEPPDAEGPGFTDVPDGSPFADAIARLAAAGVFSGCAEDGPRFCPDEPVTRGEVAALLVRAGLVDEGSGGSEA